MNLYSNICSTASQTLANGSRASLHPGSFLRLSHPPCVDGPESPGRLRLDPPLGLCPNLFYRHISHDAPANTPPQGSLRGGEWERLPTSAAAPGSDLTTSYLVDRIHVYITEGVGRPRAGENAPGVLLGEGRRPGDQSQAD